MLTTAETVLFACAMITRSESMAQALVVDSRITEFLENPKIEVKIEESPQPRKQKRQKQYVYELTYHSTAVRNKNSRIEIKITGLHALAPSSLHALSLAAIKRSSFMPKNKNAKKEFKQNSDFI